MKVTSSLHPFVPFISHIRKFKRDPHSKDIRFVYIHLMSVISYSTPSAALQCKNELKIRTYNGLSGNNNLMMVAWWIVDGSDVALAGGADK